MHYPTLATLATLASLRRRLSPHLALTTARRRKLGTLALVVITHWLLLVGLPRSLYSAGWTGSTRVPVSPPSTTTPVYVELSPALMPPPGPPVATAIPVPPAVAQGQPETEPDAPSDAPPTDEVFFGVAGMVNEDQSILLSTPAPARLQYEIQRQINGHRDFAQAELQWEHDGSSYTARMVLGDFATGPRTVVSEGQLSDKGLEPVRFEDKARNPTAVQFDRVAGKLRFGPNRPEADLTLAAQDQLSVWMQLASLFSGNADRLPAGSLLAFQAVGATAPERWVFRVAESTVLRTVPSAPSMNAIHLVREPVAQAGDMPSQMDVWLAPDLGFMPLRIRLSRSNGDFVDQLWLTSGKR